MKALMVLKIFTIAALFMVVPVLAQAASCYMPREAEAEQGIRIHSELMVIGLSCQHMTQSSQNLYSQYRDFTSRNENIFANYERTLLNYFQKNGDNAPQKRLHSLRTEFANKISQDAAKMRPDLFCNYYAPRIEKASKMSERELKSWAATTYPSHPVSKPICVQVN